MLDFGWRPHRRSGDGFTAGNFPHDQPLIQHEEELLPVLARQYFLKRISWQIQKQGAIWVEALRLIAIVSGAYLLPGKNWARWVAVAWMAVHVVVSIFHGAAQVAMHSLFLIVIAYFLFFRTASARFFR